MAKAKKRIVSVKRRKRLDENPDTSFIGEYSNKPLAGAIDRKQRGDMQRNEFRYFNPANEEYAEQDYDRAESLNAGNWCFLGLDVVAEVVLDGVTQQLTSGGLWGVESDSGRAYFDEVFTEELGQLRGVLIDAGFTAKQIDAAYADVEDSDE